MAAVVTTREIADCLPEYMSTVSLLTQYLVIWNRNHLRCHHYSNFFLVRRQPSGMRHW